MINYLHHYLLRTSTRSDDVNEMFEIIRTSSENY